MNFKDTIVITSIYSSTYGVDQMLKSVENVGMNWHNAYDIRKEGGFTGNGTVIKYIYDALRMLSRKYKYAIYSDGADTFFTEGFQPPDNQIIFSTEKACYPRGELQRQYPKARTPWRYLNGGGYCGEIELLIKFYEKYKLNTYYRTPNISGQHEFMVAYLQEIKDKEIPITLDEECKYFQTLYNEDPGDFSLDDDGLKIINLVTGTKPYILHGNGHTPMDIIYNNYKL